MNHSSAHGLIAHRGASKDAPENTLAAFRLAWEQGADAVECDIRLSLDGRIMVMHDQSALRTTGADLVIARHHSADLRNLDAGKWKSPAFAGERIPFLEEVLEGMPEGKRLFIEIKCGVEILPALGAVLPADSPSRCPLIGFDSDIMAETKRRFPDHKVYLLCEFSRRLPLSGIRTDSATLIEHAKRQKLDGLDVRSRGLTRNQVQRVRDAGLDVLAWTVNSGDEAARLFSWGVQGITTDSPGLLRDQLSAIQPD